MAAALLAAGNWVSRKDVQPSEGLSLLGGGGLCSVEEFAEEVGCSFLPAESVVEPAADAPQVVCQLLRCRLRPRLRCRGCYVGGCEAWVPEVQAAVVEVEGEEDVAAC